MMISSQTCLNKRVGSNYCTLWMNFIFQITFLRDWDSRSLIIPSSTNPLLRKLYLSHQFITHSKGIIPMFFPNNRGGIQMIMPTKFCTTIKAFNLQLFHLLISSVHPVLVRLIRKPISVGVATSIEANTYYQGRTGCTMEHVITFGVLYNQNV